MALCNGLAAMHEPVENGRENHHNRQACVHLVKANRGSYRAQHDWAEADACVDKQEQRRDARAQLVRRRQVHGDGLARRHQRAVAQAAERASGDNVLVSGCESQNKQ